jgi:hypothetical protein
MSDFIDRLAARAIGGDTALAPRLPSLFEPLSRAPLMAMAGEGEAPARPRDASPAPAAAPNAVPVPRVPTHARESTEPAAARTVPMPRVPPPAPERVAVDAPRAPPSPPHAASPARGKVTDHATAVPTPARATATPSPLSPRQSRVASARPETASTPAPNGALLPSPLPVFTATSALSTRSERTATARTATVRAENRAATTSEPVVHVSIGRLEVRAALAVATPPRRRDGPQPSSLDDYLRQRGKASP